MDEPIGTVTGDCSLFVPHFVFSISLLHQGNKYDMADLRQVETEEAKTYAEENNIFFLESSAKTNHNVRTIPTRDKQSTNI